MKEMSEEQFRLFQLKKVYKLLNKAQIELDKLSNNSTDWIIEQHSESSNLIHCLRWGLIASEELVK